MGGLLAVVIMKEYKKEFIEFLLRKGALKIGEFKLKSGRISPYFINTGVFDDGESIAKLGYFYASTIVDNFREGEYDVIFGPAYKGIPLAVATAIGLEKHFNINKGFSFNRKEPKSYGEATEQKSRIVGKIEDGDRILMVDDVLTTGHTKYEAIDLLKSIADNLKFVGLVIAVDRKEVGVKQFEQRTGIPVKPIVDIFEIKTYLAEEGKISESELRMIEDYLEKYGMKRFK